MVSVDLGGFDLFGDSPDGTDTAPPYAGSAGFGRYGHYRRPHPLTGELSDFPRVSTVVKAVKDTYALDIWQRRMLVKGLAARPGLLDLIGSTSDMEQVDKIIERAQDSAGTHDGADKGTALHSLAERVDRREPLPKGTRDHLVKDLTAYAEELRAKRVTMWPSMHERSLFVPAIDLGCDVMGTLDKVAFGLFGWPEQGIKIRERYPVTDLKTSQHDPRKYSVVDVAVQLAVYAHASHLETERGSGVWEEVKVPIDREIGLIISLPAGSATCRIFRVNIALGWELARIAVRVRQLNSAEGKRTIISPL